MLFWFAVSCSVSGLKSASAEPLFTLKTLLGSIRRSEDAKLTCGISIGIVGLAKKSEYIVDLSFDILSLEALFLVPRYVPWVTAS